MCRLVCMNTNFNTHIMVADIKAEYIQNILEKADICSNICSIYLFGSVLREDCSEDSDIDVLVVSDVARSKLYKTRGYKQFLRKLHDKDGYIQQYDVICVHGIQELEKNRHKIILYNDVLIYGRELYRKKAVNLAENWLRDLKA